MNFLAHIYLSGNIPGLIVGNFIADYVKGNKKNAYPGLIRQGIELHRAIDDFTDHHPYTEISKQRLRPKYGKYSGVIVDVYYDHFLAANFREFSTVPLKTYAASVYSLLTDNQYIMPDKVKDFLPFMVERNWLVSYATLEGVGRALRGLSKRVNFENKMDESGEDLKLMYGAFEEDFRRFFPELITFAAIRRSHADIP